MQACSLLFAMPLFGANGCRRSSGCRQDRVSITGLTMPPVHCFYPLPTYELILPAEFYSHLLLHFYTSLYCCHPFYFLFTYRYLSSLLSSPHFPYHLPFRYERTGAYGVLVGKTEGKSYLEDLVVDGMIILKRKFKKYDVGLDFIGPSRDRYKWRAAVNGVMNLRVLKNAGNFLPS